MNHGLGTRWGLFKYNWVTTKLALTFLATLPEQAGLPDADESVGIVAVLLSSLP